jgi:DNA-directed RNA polymerase specialized sigma24 family protein
MWNAGFRSVGIAFKSKDPLAENAAQSGCLKLLQFLISTGSPEWFAKNRHKLLPTLARVIRNVCMAAAREARGEVSGLILMCDYAPDGPKEVFWAANGTNQDLELDLAEQLKAMPETLRTAFQEHCDGDSFADIAARHGCSPSTIQRRYAEAVEWLQRKMQAYDRDS